MKKYMKKISRISIITVLAISILMAYAGSMYFKSSNLEMWADYSAVGSTFHLTDLGSSVYKINITGDASNYGWCIDKGANLYGGQGTVSAESNAYSNTNAREGMSGYLNWLLDNMFRDGGSVTDAEKTVYRANLQSIMNRNGVSGNIDNYTDNQIFYYEQFVIWSFTNNVTGDGAISFPTSDPLYSALKTEAQKNGSYSHSNSSVSVNKDSVQVNSNGSVGPFKVTMSGPASLTSNAGTLYKDAACTSGLANGEIYSGDLYVKVSDTSNVNVTINWNYYTTSATRYSTTGNPGSYRDQDFVMINRTSSSDSITFEQAKSGSYHLNVVKKSASDYDGITDKSKVNLDDKTTGVGGATFTLTQQVYTSSGRSDAISKSVTTENGKDTKSVFGDTEIVEEGTGADKHDIYTIVETDTPDGYLPIDLTGYTFNVYKKLDGSTFKIDYVRINNPSGSEVGRASSGTGTTAKDVLDIDENGKWDLGLEVSDNGMALCITVINVPKEGSFKVKIVKYEKNNSSKKLSGALFNVNIVDNNGKTILNSTKKTNNLGEAEYSISEIDDKDLTYTVTITETTPPAGYIGIDGPITFKATTEFDEENQKFILKEEGDITNKTGDGYELSNAKVVKIEKNQIYIEAENRTTSIDIHKGVKTVENQDSGYYSVAEKIKEAEDKQAKEDAERGTEYEDENTGKKYTEIELEDMQHEWVVETTIPEGISNYKRYLVNDPIDTTKLNFSGLGRVKVELIDSTGKVVKTLEKDKDYTTKYENDILTVTYIDKKDGNDFYGEFLSEATTSNKIRLTFNTTFKVNPETGKLVVLEGTITNAENQAKLKYDNGSGNDQDRESEKPEVHTGAVSVFKYEDTNNNGKHDEGEKALVGAEFKIALSEEDAKNGKFIKLDGEELVAVSNEHGIATFTGLSFGGDAKDDEENLKNGLYSYDWETASRDYYIVETKSPGGYKKLDEVIKVTVSKDSSEIIDLTDKINEMESVGNLPLKFDLALRKWVTHAIVTENGQSVVYETGHHAEDDPEAIVKVDLKKSKLNQVKVQFKYSIRVTNEGEIAGEAREVTDYIPEGLKFVQEDNPNWTTTSDERVVKTRLLEGVTLQPGESAEVEILLTWVNSESSMGVMVNTAEISEDYNEFGVHDIDSTPNNKKAGEDDIDDAPVMLAIKTGSETIGYVTLGIGFASIITLGAVEIKKRIL